MKEQEGFTLVELIVIISVSAIFFLSAIQLSLTISQLSSDGSQRAVASNLAYNNLRKYANGAKPTYYDCATYGNGPSEIMNVSGSYSNLPSAGAGVTQIVQVSAPYGCGDASSSGMPIRVQSQVTYGPANNRKTVTHATYATY